MNREERRRIEKLQRKAINNSHLSSQQKQIYIDLMSQSYRNDFIPQGTQVKINYQAIEERTHGEMGLVFKEWLDGHKDDIFTVEYEEMYNEKKLLACLSEDTSTPKWLFWKGDLTVIESE